jgi:putative ABC transport system permease protein
MTASHARTPGANNTAGSRGQMFMRMLSRATLVRRGRSLTALFAVLVASAVTTATLNLYTDVQAKLHKEFRSYGANVVITANDGASLPTDALARLDSLLAGRGTAAPFAFAVARTSDGSPIVVAGTEMERVRKLDSWWLVSAWPSAPGAALLGDRAAKVVSPDGKPFTLSFNNKQITLTPAGTLRTGAQEDSRIYLPLDEFSRWTGLAPSTVEVAVTGSPEAVNAAIGQFKSVLPQAKVEPVRQIVEAEGRVLGKTRMALFATTALIVLTAALCMLATLTASVLDRRKDFAVMKALGASQRMINALFAAEAASIGALGAIGGFVIGIGIAAWIGRANFSAAISPRFSILPVVLVGSVLVALFSAMLPMSLLRRVQPASILRGE